jgi:hypothetical protein
MRAAHEAGGDAEIDKEDSKEINAGRNQQAPDTDRLLGIPGENERFKHRHCTFATHAPTGSKRPLTRAFVSLPVLFVVAAALLSGVSLILMTDH